MTAQLVPTIHGPMSIPGVPDIVSRSLAHHGEWAWAESALAAALMPSHATVLDVGAHLGTFSLAIAAAGAGRVVAVEPNPGMLTLLCRNLAANARAPFAVEPVALAARRGFAAPHQITCASGEENIGSMSYRAAPAGVPACTLKDLRARHGAYDLVKLDVEGAEFEILKGDAVWIRRHHPIVWAEANETRQALRLFEFTQWAGLAATYVAWPAFRRDAFRNGAEPLHPVAFEAALVFGGGIEADEICAAAPCPDLMVRGIASARDLSQALWLTPRWGRAEWSGLGRVELLGLLARYANGERHAEWQAALQE